MPSKASSRVSCCEAEDSCDPRAVLLVEDDRRFRVELGFQDMGGGIAVSGPLPAVCVVHQEDLRLNTVDQGLARLDGVAEGRRANIAKQIGDRGVVDGGCKRCPWLARIQGIPDLQSTGDVAAVVGEQADRVVLGQPSLSGDIGAEVALGKELGEEVPPLPGSASVGDSVERHRFGEDRGAEPE